MKKFTTWLEDRFVPVMNKANGNIWVLTIKDSINLLLPVIMLGSFFCLLSIFEEYITLPFSFWTGYDWTIGKLSLFISFLIPFNFCEKKKYRNHRFAAAISGLIIFMIVATPQIETSKDIGFSSSALGAGGMFVAIITGVLVSLVFEILHSFSFFKKDSVLPGFVKNMFDMMIPMGLIVLVGWLGVQVGNIDVYAIIQEAFKPLTSFIQTLPGWILFDFALVFLYSLGISNWVLSPITEPVTLAAIAANVLMASEGVANASDLNMFTQELRFSTYMMIGGTGCTLPLVFMLLRAKSQKLKTMGRVGLVPSLFNINEPIVYGCIAWNPLLMIPMWLTAIILPCVIWIFTKIIAFAPIPTMVFNLWYCPYPVSTWLITRSINAILLMLICFIIAAMIYYPFFKVYDKQEYEQEQKALQK